ncbi:MAG: gamma-glutamyl-gamma-aminobutyrate hydrolase family protein [Leptospiraceae bacterium]|nr:gamma-glutamyl-gamma-aminobutyrate hydrolase family protein [Leptospiraceae bacterium]
MKKIFLIIDPFLSEPASDAINLISRLHHEVQSEKNNFESYIEVYFPSKESRLLNFLDSVKDKEAEIIGVVSLGSYAHITDNLEWVHFLGNDLKEQIIEAGIPFFGICFSHQLFASIYGGNVSYIEDIDSLIEKKYNEFREIQVIHPRLKSILDGKQKFISKALHAQEVKSVPEEFLEITASSNNCKIEGLVHKKFPAYSVQSHPEKPHESLDGQLLIKNFIRIVVP